jgi:hypothetical protein
VQQIDVNNSLNEELRKQILARLGAYITPPSTHGINPAVNSPVVQEFKQSSTIPEIGDKEIILLKLFGEFTKKDEGKVLASELGKFARFVQSEVAKSSSRETPVS